MPYKHSTDFSSEMTNTSNAMTVSNVGKSSWAITYLQIVVFALIVWFPLYKVEAAAIAPIDPSGLWSTKDEDSIIKIIPCDKFYCGTLVWLKEPNDEHGNPKIDDQNPDTAKRSRPMIGIEILSNMAPENDHWRGTAYNADDGKFYDVTFKVTTTKAPNDTGEIEGCILKILCKTEVFTRAQWIPGQAVPVAVLPKQTAKSGPHSSNAVH